MDFIFTPRLFFVELCRAIVGRTRKQRIDEHRNVRQIDAAAFVGIRTGAIGCDAEEARHKATDVERVARRITIDIGQAVTPIRVCRPENAAEQVRLKQRVFERFRAMAKRRVPGATAIVFVIPRHRMVGPHGVAARVVRRFVNGQQYINGGAGVVLKVVPFVAKRKRRGQIFGANVRCVIDVECGILDRRVRNKPCITADELTVPRPVVFAIGRSMNADPRAALLDVGFERGLLCIVLYVAGGAEPDDDLVLRQVGKREVIRVFG